MSFDTPSCAWVTNGLARDRYGCWLMFASSCAMASGGRQKSAQPLSNALRGMPSYFALTGSCANVMPPASLIARRPNVPSEPVPDSTMPIDRDPWSAASERKK